MRLSVGARPARRTMPGMIEAEKNFNVPFRMLWAKRSVKPAGILLRLDLPPLVLD